MAQFSECSYTRWSHDLGIIRPDDRLVTPERSTSRATHRCETIPTRGEEPPEPRVSRWAIESSRLIYLSFTGGTDSGGLFTVSSTMRGLYETGTRLAPISRSV